MSDYKLELIRSYCRTEGMRLNSFDKDLLYQVLSQPEMYDGFTSELYTENHSGRDYRDTWDSTTNWQYRISITSELCIYKRYRHSCDGYVQDENWDWGTAIYVTDTRRIIAILREIRNEL